MPIREYECSKCGNRFEALMKSSLTPSMTTTCPKCSNSINASEYKPSVFNGTKVMTK